MTNRWNFYDPTDLTTAEFDVNPKEGGSLAVEKNITTYSTVVEGGTQLYMEGNEPVQEMSFSGTIRTQAQYDDMVTMFRKRHQIQLTDDLGRTFWIMISKFEPKRIRARATPWKHSYVVVATIVDW